MQPRIFNRIHLPSVYVFVRWIRLIVKWVAPVPSRGVLCSDG